MLLWSQKCTQNFPLTVL